MYLQQFDPEYIGFASSSLELAGTVPDQTQNKLESKRNLKPMRP
jgi:hypothetical protein